MLDFLTFSQLSMVNYILINLIGGQIREEIDFGLSELASQARPNSENLSQFYTLINRFGGQYRVILPEVY